MTDDEFWTAYNAIVLATQELDDDRLAQLAAEANRLMAEERASR